MTTDDGKRYNEICRVHMTFQNGTLLMCRVSTDGFRTIDHRPPSGGAAQSRKHELPCMQCGMQED
eukprot:13682523-Alexandrium_andersonii.AAC.1